MCWFYRHRPDHAWTVYSTHSGGIGSSHLPEDDNCKVTSLMFPKNLTLSTFRSWHEEKGMEGHRLNHTATINLRMLSKGWLMSSERHSMSSIRSRVVAVALLVKATLYSFLYWLPCTTSVWGLAVARWRQTREIWSLFDDDRWCFYSSYAHSSSKTTDWLWPKSPCLSVIPVQDAWLQDDESGPQWMMPPSQAFWFCSGAER